MIVMVLNSGSSSIKFQLLQMQDRGCLCRGLIERIGLDDAIFTYQPHSGESSRRILAVRDHGTGIELALRAVTDPVTGVLASLAEIRAVGHRIVHGGEKITKSELLSAGIIRIIEECSVLAPLHNPPNLLGVEAITRLLPGVPQVGVFDTAFHAAMPDESYIYALPYEYYRKHGIRRFGFHGTSHQYVARRTAEILGKPYGELNCITCHLGNGVSLTAVRGGRSVDTTLGYGTMCGVPMGTRAGDVDPAVILTLIGKLGLSTDEVHRLLYKESGLRGLSGLTNDMRDVVLAASEGNQRADLTLRVFAHCARKHIAAMATNLEGRLDAIVFTAGIGEYSTDTRARICAGLEVLGARLDPAKNRVEGQEAIISSEDSVIPILVVPTNEELMIALDTEEIVTSLQLVS
jgi:acetate kinase